MTIRLTSFATYKDLRGYIKCLIDGKSETECYNFGDNGVGSWGDVTAQESVPMCAIGKHLAAQHYGSWNAAHNKEIRVTLNGQSVVCKVGDKGPDAICDLNPAALKALGLSVETELSETGTIEFL